jgi:type IV pilus assembly protein PilE
MKAAGLTLVELMVVVAVLAVLAGIAYPLYTNQTQKARRAEAKIALENIALAQERFYTVNGRYSVDYTELYVGTLAAEASGLGWPCGSATSCGTANGHYNVALANGGNTQTFQLTAVPDAGGKQSGDASYCSSFTFDHLGSKGSTGSATNCW